MSGLSEIVKELEAPHPLPPPDPPSHPSSTLPLILGFGLVLIVVVLLWNMGLVKRPPDTPPESPPDSPPDLESPASTDPKDRPSPPGGYKYLTKDDINMTHKYKIAMKHEGCGWGFMVSGSGSWWDAREENASTVTFKECSNESFAIIVDGSLSCTSGTPVWDRCNFKNVDDPCHEGAWEAFSFITKGDGCDHCEEGQVAMMNLAAKPNYLDVTGCPSGGLNQGGVTIWDDSPAAPPWIAFKDLGSA